VVQQLPATVTAAFKYAADREMLASNSIKQPKSSTCFQIASSNWHKICWYQTTTIEQLAENSWNQTPGFQQLASKN
jgi:hypothetical protein